MHYRQALRANFQQPMVIAGLSVITGHLVLSSLIYMEAGHFERVFWAVVATTVLGLTAYAYPGLQRAVRGLVCVSIAIPALAFGIGVHAVHVAQIGFREADYTGIPMLIVGAVLLVAGSTFLVRTVHTWWRRLLLIPVAPLVFFFVIFPVTLGVGASNVAHVPCCDETPADYGFVYEDVIFKTEAGLTLTAWYVPSQNGAVIVTVHGAGGNRATVMPEATMLARHGYGVLMLDLEGFGDSEGRANAFGWIGARDVDAAVAYLRSRPDVDPDRIGGLGLSMGGEVLIQAAAQTPGLASIVAEGVSGRTAADFREMDDAGYDYVSVPIHTVVGVTMRLISGESTPPPLKEMASQIGPKPVLLITADITEETELGELYIEVGGPSFQMWTIPEPEHIRAYDLHPEEYEQRVIAFFDEALLRKGGAGATGVR